ncbi:MAG: cupredoxin domain-containing protein [Candidatus Tectomicrobia bacterium]|nr:cupredoxin domain-containing protein [Candidatus Tectomicrobia bacterium]
MHWAVVIGVLISILAFPWHAAADTAKVQVGHNRLEPAEISIKVGDSVAFHNEDEMPGGHTIVADEKSFTSPPLGKDKSWTHTFTDEGTFTYHIKEHPGAKGKIVVQEKK